MSFPCSRYSLAASVIRRSLWCQGECPFMAPGDEYSYYVSGKLSQHRLHWGNASWPVCACPAADFKHCVYKDKACSLKHRQQEGGGGGTKEEDLMTLIRKQGSCGDVRRRCAADASLEKEGWGYGWGGGGGGGVSVAGAALSNPQMIMSCQYCIH